MTANKRIDCQGASYAQISQLKDGDFIMVDSSFRCLTKGIPQPVCADREGQLFLKCKMGVHYLDSISAEHDLLLGMYKIAT